MIPPWQEHKRWQNPIASIARGDGVTLTLDPHPGSIGGRVSGTVNLPRTIPVTGNCVVHLSCLSSVTSATEDADDGSEILWTQQVYATPHHGHDSVAVPFTFDIPDSMPESLLPLGGASVDWQLTITSAADGGELEYSFSVPVFATRLYGERSAQTIPDAASLLTQWRAENSWQPYRAVIESEHGSLVIRLGPWRGGMFQAGGVKGLVTVLLCFAVSLVLLTAANDGLVSTVVTGVFGLAGLFVTGLAAYLWARVVEVRAQPGQLSIDRRVFGRTIQRRELPVEDIVDLPIRFSQLYVVSRHHGELAIIDSVHDRRLLNALRDLVADHIRA